MLEQLHVFQMIYRMKIKINTRLQIPTIFRTRSPPSPYTSRVQCLIIKEYDIGKLFT